MAFDMIKYERGQVWRVHFKNPNEQRGREEKKDRPWLILSVGKFNVSAGMITAVPISTREKAVTVAQVAFQNSDQKTNVIMCEQIRTFDYLSGDYSLEYMGQLSDKILEKVDVALSVHLGIHYSPITLNSLYDSMEAVIKSIGYLEKGERFTDEDVERFANKLKSIASKSMRSEEAPMRYDDKEIEDSIKNIEEKSKDADKIEEIRKSSTVNYNPDNPQVRKFYKRFHMTEAPENSLVSKKPTSPVKESFTSVEETPKKSRIKWTPEKCNEFLEDSKKLPLKEMMQKWNISTPNRYYVMRNYVQNLVLKLQQRNQK